MAVYISVLAIASVFCSPPVTAGGAGGSSALSRLASNVARSFCYFGLAVAARAAAHPWQGQLVAFAPHVNVALGVLMCALTLLPKPVIPCVVCGVLVVRPLAELTSQSALLYYSNAFVAQLAQGVAHDVSKQKATLLSHQDSMADRRVRLAFEWSHAVYFPNILLQSCYQSLVGSGKTA